VREALNSALDEEMSADPSVFLMGEEVPVPPVTQLVIVSSPLFSFVLIIAASVVGWGVPRSIQGQ
jgi:hypothetical protein